jgi:hypothetical protein
VHQPASRPAARRCRTRRRPRVTLLGNLGEVAEDLDAGAIVVFTNDNIRIRKLPVGH